MDQRLDRKIVLVTQKTRLENLVRRYNTVDQAEFYVKHHGGDFDDYRQEHETYYTAVDAATVWLQPYGRLQMLDREFVSSYLFGPQDLVVAVGRDGLVANILKYLTTQHLIGVNPDPARWDGILLPFAVSELKRVVSAFFKGECGTKSVTLAVAKLNDHQQLYGVNDLFIGQKGHASARYTISVNGKTEVQSSSGIIVSTGLGSTGWLKSIVTGAKAIGRFYGDNNRDALSAFAWDAERLIYNVREPYPSMSTGATIVFGEVVGNQTITVTSLMPENGVIFSDGMEQDFLQFNSGAIAEVGIAEKKGMLVV